MRINKFLLFVFSVFLFSFSVSSQVTGRVVDGDGGAVQGAMVTFTDLDHRLVYTYTESDGSFYLPNPEGISVDELVDPDGFVGVKDRFIEKRTKSQVAAFNASVKGQKLLFRMNESKKINISLFNINGKKLGELFNGKLNKGTYGFNPLSAFKGGLASQVYAIRISDGSASQSVKMYNFGRSTESSKIQTVESANSAGSILAKPAKINAVDSIRAGKTYYSPAFTGIESYGEDVGDLTITLRDIESKVDSIVAGMTNDEKARECSQGVDYSKDPSFGTVFFGVGNGGGYTERVNTVTSDIDASLSNNGIPLLYAIDAVHGFISPVNGTVFPHNLNLGASNNMKLIELVERITAIECYALGINWSFAPCMDIVRNERHGRTYEGFSEDPGYSAECAVAAVRGFQGTDLSHPYTIAATAKHYTGAGGTTNGTHGTNANTASYEELCRIHLQPFKAAAQQAGAATIMAAFNQFDGTEMHAHHDLLTDTLKNSWNWDGFIVGDWDEAFNAGGAAVSFAAGVDNPMIPSNVWALVNDMPGALGGTVSQARLDDGVSRILRTKYKMGLFADPYPHDYMQSTVKSDLHKAVARAAVRQSLVLLKNDGNALPLEKGMNVHLVGEHAYDMSLQCGGWTLGWPTGATATTPEGTRIREAFEAASSGNTTYSATAGSIPSDADAIVVCVGEDPYAEGGGDASDLSLSSGSLMHSNATSMINSCLSDANGRPVIVLLFSGRPMIITDELAESDAFVFCGLIGTQGAGVTDVIYGDYDFTAKLTHTWPASFDQIPVNTGDYQDATGSGGTPLFDYGYGLTYN